MIDWMNADVYLLQEVTQTEFRKLRHAYPAYHWFFQPHAFHYWKESTQHEWNGNAVAVKKSLGIHPLKKHSLRLSKGNRGLMVTGMLKGTPVAFVSLHLDDVSDQCRTLQLDKMLNMTTSVGKHRIHISPRTLLIVGGDLNDEFGTVIKHFQRHGFQTSPSTPTYFEESPMALDYLMVRRGTPLSTLLTPFWYIPPSNRTDIVLKFGSDHLPVTGILQL
jgi:endonuclease/exonuclease/phosphatase family metal-dependent hydrolase